MIYIFLNSGFWALWVESLATLAERIHWFKADITGAFADRK